MNDVATQGLHFSNLCACAHQGGDKMLHVMSDISTDVTERLNLFLTQTQVLPVVFLSAALCVCKSKKKGKKGGEDDGDAE